MAYADAGGVELCVPDRWPHAPIRGVRDLNILFMLRRQLSRFDDLANTASNRSPDQRESNGNVWAIAPASLKRKKPDSRIPRGRSKPRLRSFCVPASG